MDCPICLDKFTSSAFSLSCGHLFHRDCINPLINQRFGYLTCPLCRRMTLSTFQEASIREVFFNSTNVASDSTVNTEASPGASDAVSDTETVGQLRSRNILLRADNLIIKARLSASQEQEASLRRTISELKEQLKGSAEKLEEMQAKRTKWKRRAQESEEEVTYLMTEIDELDEVKRERDSLKRQVLRLRTEVEAEKAKAAEAADREALLALRARPRNPAPTRRSANATRSTSPQVSDSDSSNVSITVESRNAQARVNNRRRVLPASVNAKERKTQVLRYGKDILHIGYRFPLKTGVPDCTTTDGRHSFSGKGSNQYQKKYTCGFCGFHVSERA